jgi:hypothetical protein
LSAEFVDDFTKCKGYISKLRQKTFVVIVWKCGKKPVLARLGRYC